MIALEAAAAATGTGGEQAVEAMVVVVVDGVEVS
jgi:hypothetical protein